MSIKEGTKMLYCKVAGDKTTEEEVDVIYVHSESAGGGVTIYIPSLKRERDTDVSRLSHIVEKKAKIDNYFGKPRLELPEISGLVIADKSLKDVVLSLPSQMVSIWNTIYGNQSGPLGSHGVLGVLYNRESLVELARDIYIKTDNLHHADEILLDNQRLLFNQLNALQETIKSLQRKPSSPVDEELQREIAELRKMNAHHRQMNTQLLASQREMREEMIAMRAEMAELRSFMKSSE
jgi:hypothetical protein